MSTKRARGECDARACHERATQQVASFYPGEEAGIYCAYHAMDERSRQQAAKISTYGQAQKWVQTGRVLQQDPCAMGYLGQMMGSGQQQMLCGQQPQYYQPGQMPQQQMVTYGGGACVPMAGACGPMMGGFAASAPIPIPGAGYLPVATAMPAHMQQHGVPVAFRWQ